MPRGGLRSTSFKPGASGNPGGRPKTPQTIAAKRIAADVKAMARECAPEAISTLKEIMLDAEAPPPARIGAAQAILDRGCGKPRQNVDLYGTLAFHDLSMLTDEQMVELDRLFSIIELANTMKRQDLLDPN